MKRNTKNTTLFLLLLLIIALGCFIIWINAVDNFKDTAIKFTDNSIIFNSFPIKSKAIIYCKDRVVDSKYLEADDSLFIYKKEFKQDETCNVVYTVLGLDIKIPLTLDLTPPVVQDNIPVLTKKNYVQGKVFSNEVSTIKILGEGMEFAAYDTTQLDVNIPLNKGLNTFKILVQDESFNTTEKELKIYRK